MQIKIKKNTKEYNEFNVSFSLTEGAILTLYHALEKHTNEGSAIAGDLLCFLIRAANEAGIKF